MKIKPVLMKGAEVRAILDGRKTMMRRPIKIQPPSPEWQMAKLLDGPKKNIGKHYWVRLNEDRVLIKEADYRYFSCPYDPGDLPWVRETFAAYGNAEQRILHYEADSGRELAEEIAHSKHWKPSVHMPRWASRLTLRVTEVRAERLQSICEKDCIAEGCPGGHGSIPGYNYSAVPKEHFFHAWKEVYGPESLKANPWVWVVKFEPVNSNVDEI